MKKLSLLLGVAVVMLAGCTSNSTTPDDDIESFLATKAGTYILGNVQVVSKTSAGSDTVLADVMDSITYAGTAAKADSKGTTKTATLYIRHYNGVPVDTLYYAEEGAKLYMLFELGTTVPGLGSLDFGNRWIVVGDQQNGSWTSLQDSITGMNIVYQNIPLTVDVTMNILGKKNGKEQLSIGGSNVEAMHYHVDYTLLLDISMNGILPISTSPIVMPIDIWVVEKLGTVKENRGQSSLTIGAPANQTVYIPGYTYAATAYHIP